VFCTSKLVGRKFFFARSHVGRRCSHLGPTQSCISPSIIVYEQNRGEGLYREEAVLRRWSHRFAKQLSDLAGTKNSLAAPLPHGACAICTPAQTPETKSPTPRPNPSTPNTKPWCKTVHDLVRGSRRACASRSCWGSMQQRCPQNALSLSHTHSLSHSLSLYLYLSLSHTHTHTHTREERRARRGTAGGAFCGDGHRLDRPIVVYRRVYFSVRR